MTVKVTFEAEDAFELTNVLANVVSGHSEPPQVEVPFDVNPRRLDFMPEWAELKGKLIGKVAAVCQEQLDHIDERLSDLEETLRIEKADHECEPADLYWSVDFEEAQRVSLVNGVMWRKPRIGQLHNVVDVRVTFCQHCHKLMVEVKEHQDEEQEEKADEQNQAK